jgi:Ca2+-binding EF-hand superfamily protein
MMVKMSQKDSLDDIKKAFNLFKDGNNPKVLIFLH